MQAATESRLVPDSAPDHNARAATAVDVLDALAARMPFAVRAISVDNGSESMAEFETACQSRGIVLFTLPPRSPNLHGSVERANRTHTEEFYEVTDAASELEALQTGLADWELCYNAIRPPPGPGLSHPGRIPRLGRHRCVTDVPDQFSRLTPFPDRPYHPPDDDAPCARGGAGAFACL